MVVPVSLRSQVPANVKASFRPDGKGGGTLKLKYAGPLSDRDPIWVRVGEKRGGKEWLQSRDVMMKASGAKVEVSIPFAPGEKLEGIELAFHCNVGRAGQEIWDNAGKPYGYYLVHTANSQVEAR